MVDFLDRFRGLRVDSILWIDKFCDRDCSGVGIDQRFESRLKYRIESDKK